MLPIIGVVKRLDPNFQEGNIEQSHIPAALKYDKLIEAVANQAGKKDDFVEMKYKNTIKKN